MNNVLTIISYIIGALILALGISNFFGVGISDSVEKKYTRESVKTWMPHSGISYCLMGVGFLCLNYCVTQTTPILWLLITSTIILLAGIIYLFYSKMHFLVKATGKTKKEEKEESAAKPRKQNLGALPKSEQNPSSRNAKNGKNRKKKR
ncbi:MAG: hypothetical protein ACOYB8_01530 [Eubacteriaceae bacterium]|jgi:threonine/homoserine/homoserine lactone efflux protein